MNPQQRVASPRDKTVALVLGSGGARGYAHIGVIEELEARGYRVVAVSGCSMGALVGGVYAAGQLAAYRDWVCQLDYFDVLRLVDVTWSPMGAMRANKVMSKLESLIDDIRIEDLDIAVTTVATDLTRQREVWFQSGALLEAIRASIAVPGVITPVHRGDQVLVDGGLLNPLPIIPTVSAQADFVMAVNVTAHSPRPVSLEELLPPTRRPRSRRGSRPATPVASTSPAGSTGCAGPPVGSSTAWVPPTAMATAARPGAAARRASWTRPWSAIAGSGDAWTWCWPPSTSPRRRSPSTRWRAIRRTC